MINNIVATLPLFSPKCSSLIRGGLHAANLESSQQGFLLVKLKSSLRKFYGRRHNLVNSYGISGSQMSTGMFHSLSSILITGFVTRVTRRMPLVQQELLTLTGHFSSSPNFTGVRVAQSLVFCVCFVDRCLSFCLFSFGHCFVYPSIYGF